MSIENYKKQNRDEILEAGYPKAAEDLQLNLLDIDGVFGVSLEKYHAEEFTEDSLILPGIYANLPHALLRRTQWGFENEIYISLQFQIYPPVGLLALEFVSWAVRDLSRSGMNIQIRSIGYPPMEEQFGRTLTFVIDIFFLSQEQNMDDLLVFLQEIADFIKENYEETKALF